MSLRLIPNLNVFRPADAVETAECWALALRDAQDPSVLALVAAEPAAGARSDGGPEPAAPRVVIACAACRGRAQGRARRDRLRGCGGAGHRRGARSAGNRRRTWCRCRASSCSMQQDAAYREDLAARSTRSRCRSKPAQPSAGNAFIGHHGLRIGLDRLRRLGAGRCPLRAFRLLDRGHSSHEARSRKTEQAAGVIRMTEGCHQRLRPHRPPRRARHPRAGRITTWSWSRSTTWPTPRPTPCCSRATATHGRFRGDGQPRGRHADPVNGRRIKVTAGARSGQPAVQGTGRRPGAGDAPASSPTRRRRQKHLDAGAKRVLISAPAKGADMTVVFGVNDDKLTPR